MTATADDQPKGVSGLQLRLLGPVELRADGAIVPIAQLGLRALLAVLALSAGRLVTTESLIQALWGEGSSSEREQALHVRVYKLRRLLTTAEPGMNASRLETVLPGYRLRLDASELDVEDFHAWAERGRAAARTGDAVGATRLLSDALALWRGPALADVVTSSDWLAGRAEALEERRLNVVEDYGDAALAAGGHRELCAPLADLVRQHPLREKLRAQLMLALFRSGRQADALGCFQRGRIALAGELGIDPNRELQELHQRMLESDPALLLRDDGTAVHGAAVGAAVARPGSVPRQLPPSVRHFAGRDPELKELNQLLDAADRPGGALTIAAISGTAGIGKTTLALHWAHQIAERFPDGQLHVNLRGFDPGGPAVLPRAATLGFLEALGVRQDELPATAEAQAGLYRSLLAQRRMLIVLDNARDAAQVRPLLPASPGSVVLVTSRSALSGLAVSDGAALIALDLVSVDEALRLLAARLGADRLAAEPQAVSDVIEHCGRLPLALAVTAARAVAAPGLPLAALADALVGEPDRLDALELGEEETSLRVALRWSYYQLTESAATMFRLLGLHPGPDISIPAAASLAGVDLEQAIRSLTELTEASLLIEHPPGRYALHDLLRIYAAEVAATVDTEAVRREAIGRVLDHYLHTGWAACVAVEPASPLPLPQLRSGAAAEQLAGRSGALRWLRSEHVALQRAAILAGRAGFDQHAWQISWILALDSYIRFWDHDADLATVNAIATAAAERLGDPISRGGAFLATAFDYRRAGRLDESVPMYEKALACFDAAGDQGRQADAQLGLSDALIDQNRLVEALDYAQKAADNYGLLGRHHGASLALALASWMHVALGQPSVGRDVARHAVALCEDREDRAFYAAVGWISAGYASYQLNDQPEAISCYERAISICTRHQAFAIDHADALFGLGESYAALGNTKAAAQAWQEGLSILGAKNLRPLARHRWGNNPAERILARLERQAV